MRALEMTGGERDGLNVCFHLWFLVLDLLQQLIVLFHQLIVTLGLSLLQLQTETHTHTQTIKESYEAFHDPQTR